MIRRFHRDRSQIDRLIERRRMDTAYARHMKHDSIITERDRRNRIGKGLTHI